MASTQKISKILRETYGPFFPYSQKKKELFLDQVRAKVEYYKSQIENKCEIDLGAVKVKDNKYWLVDFLSHSAHQRIADSSLNERGGTTKLEQSLIYIVSFLTGIIAAGPLFIYNSVSGADFRQYNGVIYVPFGYMNRFEDLDLEKRTRRLDWGIVHELSHILWEKILGRAKGYSSAGREWYEGFATFCADEYFSDLYLEGVERIPNLPQRYLTGKKKVEQSLKRYGIDVLEIPKKWEILERDFSQI